MIILNSLFLSIPRFSTIDRSIPFPICNCSIEFDWKTKGQVNHICLTRLEFLFKLLINPIWHCCRYTTSICYSVLYDNIKIICSCFREILWNYKQIIFILCSVIIRMFRTVPVTVEVPENQSKFCLAVAYSDQRSDAVFVLDKSIFPDV